MAILHISQLIRSEGFERIISRCDRITILGDYPTDASMIAPNSYGHTDLTSANFERSTSADDEIVITVKGIPAIDVLLDDLDLKYIALHSKTNLNYWLVLSLKSTAYEKGEAVVIPNFTITLKVNDSNQHLSADMVWQGNADFATKCGRVMLCKGVPKTRTEVSQMHLGTKTLTPADFEQVGSGDDSRMMLKEQRMPAASKSGRVESIAMLERTTSDNFAVSRISNPLDIAQGAIVDINGVGFKIEQGAGGGHDPRTKPSGQVKIDSANSLARDLLYYTLDFKTEMVNNYDMPHVGTDIQWDADSKNVSFISTETKTKHNHIRLGSAIDDGNLLAQAATIIFKFKQPNNVGTKGTLLTNFNDADDGHLEIDLPDGLGDAAFWAGTWGSASVTTAQLSSWHTYAFTRGGDVDNTEDVYIDGVAKGHADNANVRRYSNQFFRIGGFDILQGTTETEYASFLGNLEYFAMWKRKLTPAEIASFSEKPYEIIIDKVSVDKPTGYQAINVTKKFSENLIHYTSSWIDDIASNYPIYPESLVVPNKPLIDPVTQNLLFDGNFNHTQIVNFGGDDKLSSDKFTVSIRLKLHSTARSKTLDHALWGFLSASSTNHVEAKITGKESDGYKIIFSIGNYSVSTDVTWNLLTSLKTWSFTYDSNNRITIYRESKLVATKDIVGRRGDTVGSIRVGYNNAPMEKTFPGEVEYLAVWNDAFNSVKLHDFLEFPYAHLKSGMLRNRKPVDKGVLDRTQAVTNDLTTYVFDAQNEVIRDRALQIIGEADVSTNTAFADKRTVFDIQTSKQKTLQRYETHACVKGYRPANDPAEPNVDNRTVTFRAKLLPKPPGSPSDVVPHQSTLFCCADSAGASYKHQRWHVYYYGNGTSHPEIVYEYGDMWLKYPYPLADALNFHDFAFRVVQKRNQRTLTIWIDGEKVDSKTATNEYDVNNLQFRLGGYRDLLDVAHIPYIRFKGVVDSYGIWKRALTEAEIKKIHREPYVPVVPNLNVKPNPDDLNLTIKPMDLTKDIRFYTLDFKKELVHQYDMPKTGNDIEFLGAPSFNVKFKSNTNRNQIYLSTEEFARLNPISKDYITIIYKVKAPTIGGAGGNYYCIADGGDSNRLSSHCAWRSSNGKYRWVTDIGAFSTTRMDVNFGDTGAGTPAWPTMAVRLKKPSGSLNAHIRTAFVDGKVLYDVGTYKSGEYHTPNVLVIGGWNNSSGYAGSRCEMEYFAMWDRALSDDEIRYFTNNPYSIIQGAPKALIDPTITVVDPEEDS